MIALCFIFHFVVVHLSYWDNVRSFLYATLFAGRPLIFTNHSIWKGVEEDKEEQSGLFIQVSQSVEMKSIHTDPHNMHHPHPPPRHGHRCQNTLRIAHLRIGYLVGNPEVGNPDPYQSSGLPTSIITLFFTLSA